MTALATALHSATPVQWHQPILPTQQPITPYDALFQHIENDDLCTQLTELLASKAPEAVRLRETLAQLAQEPEPEPDSTCVSCAGTGEGQYDWGSCLACRGRGHA